MPPDLPETEVVGSIPLQQEMREERSQENARIIYVVIAAVLLSLPQLVGIADRFDNLPLAWIVVLVQGLYTALVFLWLRKRPAPSKPRRLLNILMDITAVTAAMGLLGAYGALFYPLYLGIITGNGMRFGPRYFLAALGVAGVELAALIGFNDYWSGQPIIGAALLVGLAILPLFNWVLIKRLFSLNQELDRRVSERTAELQEANTELARANRSKNEFLSTMSHEFRTPLTSVLGLSQILANRSHGPLNETQLEYVTAIEESGQQLLALINDILDVARIESDRVELDLGDADIQSICEGSVRMVSPAARKKGISVALSIGEQPLLMRCDGPRLKQMLVNLLSNAVKFTREGGHVGLEVETDAGAEVIRFHVWDTGIGISEEDLPLLFRPFVQLDSRLAREYEGTGLGLMLVYRLADLHGGGVSVQSTPGEGSRFTLQLPWEPGLAGPIHEGAATAPVAAPASVATPRKILLAEDHAANATVVRAYLQGLGHRVRVARDGLQALDLAREERPDLILMDIQMPGMDGLKAIHRIRSDPELERIFIVALTALTMSGDRERCLRAGADDYLPKPFRLERLGEMVAEVFAGASATAPRPLHPVSRVAEGGK